MIKLSNFQHCAELRCEPVPKAFGMRRGAQVLGSSGKQIAYLLPTFLMTINQLDEKVRKGKNLRIRKQTGESLVAGKAQ